MFDTVAYFTLRRLTPHLPPVSYSLTFSVFPPNLTFSASLRSLQARIEGKTTKKQTVRQY